jgi:deoxyribonuclease-4
MFGAHCSIAGGLENALLEAERLRADCVQIFTKNQRQWRCLPLRDDQLRAWHSAVERTGWTSREGDAPCRIASHNCYLVNLASSSAEILEKSLAVQRVEMENCERLGIPLLVTHPGAHLGARPARPPGDDLRPKGVLTRDERAGLRRIARALDRLHRDLPGYQVMTCIETTAGSGTNLGSDFHHLRIIRELVKSPERVGFCFDTCHVTAAGYDMTTDERAAEVLEYWDSVCGLENLRIVHINDSKGPVGSRIDRHDHIGKGRCGLGCFRTVVNHPRLRGVPKILETPKGQTRRGTSFDLLNIRRLRRLMAAS